MRDAQKLEAQVRLDHISKPGGLPDSDDDATFVKAQTEKHRANTDPNKILSDIFEAAIMNCIAEIGWLGENVEVSYSPYDDFKNGVDVVIAIKDKSGHVVLALAVDVTFGAHDVHDKFSEIKYEIDRGGFGTIKYPGLKRANILTPQTHVLHCVAAFTKETIVAFIPLWVNKDKAIQQARIATHPIRHLVVQQIFEQLNAHSRYILAKLPGTMSDDLRNSYTLAMQKYDRALDALRPLNEIAKTALAKPNPDFERVVTDPTAANVIFKSQPQQFASIIPTAPKRRPDAKPQKEAPFVPPPFPPTNPNQPRIPGKLALPKAKK